MNKPIQAYPVGCNAPIANWMPACITYDMKKADVVVFPGGADVNPELYGAKRHFTTHIHTDLDDEELAEYRKAIDLGKPIVGICRGAQLMCAMAGGQLVQDQADPANRHPVYTYDGVVIEVSSSHHQAMFPWQMSEDNFKVLGWSFGQSPFHQGGEKQEMVIGSAPLDMEVEICFFPKIKALGIQAHPEWQYESRHTISGDQYAVDYYNLLLTKLLDGEKFEDAHRSFEELIITK